MTSRSWGLIAGCWSRDVKKSSHEKLIAMDPVPPQGGSDMVTTFLGFPIVEVDDLPKCWEFVIMSGPAESFPLKALPPVEQEDGSMLFRFALVEGPAPP